MGNPIVVFSLRVPVVDHEDEPVPHDTRGVLFKQPDPEHRRLKVGGLGPQIQQRPLVMNPVDLPHHMVAYVIFATLAE